MITFNFRDRGATLRIFLGWGGGGGEKISDSILGGTRQTGV